MSKETILKETISYAGLINKLAMAPNNCKMKFTLVTQPKMNKTGLNGAGEKISNPYLNTLVEKRATIEGKIKFNYASEVNKQRLDESKEADFVAKERKWGTRDGCFVSHTPKGLSNPEFYMEVKVEKTNSSRYYINETNILKEELSTFLPKRKPSAQQDLKKEVVVRTVKLASIKEAKIGTKEYIIK
jgi:hypothetical protein